MTIQKIRQSRGPTIQFDGKLIAENSTNQSGQKDRWHENELWETKGGAWVAVSIFASSREGEENITKAEVIEDEAELDRQLAVMDFLEWSPCARKMSRGLGWRLVIEVA